MHYPYIVIGAGAGGLVVAIGLAKAGKKVLLIEKGHYGGDCTNFGCIPSKSLIASANIAYAANHGNSYGLTYELSQFNADGALERVREIVQEIREEEEPEALHKLGVDTLTGIASFIDPHTLKVTAKEKREQSVSADRIVIAAGSSPMIPPIDGLDQVSYLTNETIFDLKEIPKKLAIIGGGPIGTELAQAFRRLGAEVSIIEADSHILPREEPQAQQVMKQVFQKEGISLYTQTKAIGVKKNSDGLHIELENQKTKEHHTLAVSHLLIAVGRRPNLKKLHLEAAGIETSKQGIRTDRYGRTTQKHIWALGDIVGGAMFTHVAESQARTILTNLLLPWPIRFQVDNQPIPRTTFTDPEVAAVGLTEVEAGESYGSNRIAVYTLPFENLDRARTSGQTEGFVKIVTKKWSSKILGATIVAPRAGEMLCQVSTAMHQGIPLRKLASLIHPYPTYSLAIRKCADMWLTQTILPLFRRKK